MLVHGWKLKNDYTHFYSSWRTPMHWISFTFREVLIHRIKCYDSLKQKRNFCNPFSQLNNLTTSSYSYSYSCSKAKSVWKIQSFAGTGFSLSTTNTKKIIQIGIVSIECKYFHFLIPANTLMFSQTKRGWKRSIALITIAVKSCLLKMFFRPINVQDSFYSCLKILKVLIEG